MTASHPWARLPTETPRAYAAFCIYYPMPVRERSIDAAYRAASGQTVSGKRALPIWFKWSSQYDWPARAAAWDAHLAALDDELWAQRRRESRLRDFAQADAIRDIVDAALPHAEQFFQRKTTFIKATNGAPDREIITLAFDIVGLSRVLTDASKLQRLASELSTENIQYSGAALDAIIVRELARLADGGETRLIDALADDEPGDDAGAGA